MESSRRLEDCYSGAVFDVLREFGITDCTLPSEILPLSDEMTVSGPAFTMTGKIVHDVSEHETLLRWTEFLSKAPSGAVVVCQPNDSTIAHMGELSAETLKLKGVDGYVVDGGTRDSMFVKNIGFPVFSRYRTPQDVVGRWIPTEFECDIQIGSTAIRSGDYMYGDLDGVLKIPVERLDEVVARVREVMATENLVRKAILGGADPKDAYLEFGLF